MDYYQYIIETKTVNNIDNRMFITQLFYPDDTNGNARLNAEYPVEQYTIIDKAIWTKVIK